MSSQQEEQLRLQAARVLEDIETLQHDYGPLLAEREPELRRALEAAAVALRCIRNRDGRGTPSG